MSYDILFVPRRPGQAWESALDEAEGRDLVSEALRPERLAQWDRVVATLRTRVGEVAVVVDDDVCEATLASGLQVSLYPDEASISFPDREREDVRAFHDLVVDLVGLLERETGLHAWDAQTEEPFDGRVHDEPGPAPRADAGHVGPDPGTLPVAPSEPGTPTVRPDHDIAAAVARERRRALVYVATGVLVLALALSLGDGGRPSTLAGLAIVIGVFDVVLGGLMYLGASRRAAGRGRAG